MRPFIRTLIALLAAALVGMAAFAAPALARPVSGPSTNPSPTASPSGTRTTPSPSNAKRLTFGIGPAAPVPSDHYVDGRPYISALSAAGGVIRDDVALLNDSRKPVTLTVYPADAVQNGSNNFQLSLKNQKLTAAGSWFTLKGGRKSLVVTVPGSHAGAGNRNVPGRLLIPIEGRVPFNATPGDHAAAIMAELDAKAKNAVGANVTLQQRLGVAVYVHLTGPLHSGVQVSNLKAHWNEPGSAGGTSRYTVTYTVTNTGNVRVNVSNLINTSRWFLHAIQSYPGEITNVFPGSKINVSQTLPGVFGFGPWHVTASAFATPVDTTLTLTTAPGSQSISLWPVPWILIVIIIVVILLLLLIGWGYLRWRKHRKAHPPVKGTRSNKQKGAKAKATVLAGKGGRA
ncbi:MAG: hypothetical protein ACTHJM_12915 [Marmoricola sp.]